MKNAYEGNISESTLKPVKRIHFKFVSIEKINKPEGGTGEHWYRYVIENGRSTITGCRCGTRQDVVQYAVDFTEHLNSRGGTMPRTKWSTRQNNTA